MTPTLLLLHTINHTEQPSQLSKNEQNCQFKGRNPLGFPNVGAYGWYVTIVTLHMGHPPLRSSLFRDIWPISGKCTQQNLEKSRRSRVSAPVGSSTSDSEGQSEVKPLHNRWLKSAQLSGLNTFSICQVASAAFEAHRRSNREEVVAAKCVNLCLPSSTQDHMFTGVRSPKQKV